MKIESKTLPAPKPFVPTQLVLTLESQVEVDGVFAMFNNIANCNFLRKYVGVEPTYIRANLQPSRGHAFTDELNTEQSKYHGI